MKISVRPPSSDARAVHLPEPGTLANPKAELSRRRAVLVAVVAMLVLAATGCGGEVPTTRSATVSRKLESAMRWRLRRSCNGF